MKKYLIATALATCLAASASAADYELIIGKMSYTPGKGSKQAIGIKNNTPNVANYVWVTCRFFQGNKLLGYGLVEFTGVKPGITYDEADDDATDLARKDGRACGQQSGKGGTVDNPQEEPLCHDTKRELLKEKADRSDCKIVAPE
jgi:hypothetical protein